MESKSSKCICTHCWITRHQSVKRKFDEIEDDDDDGPFLPSDSDHSAIARVEMESERVALREALISQRKTMEHLFTELEEERSASSTAASEAMSMIERLQREKAEIQMEDRQIKRFVEEKMEHDRREMLVLEDLLYKRQHIIESLSCELQAYKHRLMSFGLSEAEVSGGALEHDRCFSGDGNFSGDLVHEYPPLKCDTDENRVRTDPEESGRIAMEYPLDVDERWDRVDAVDVDSVCNLSEKRVCMDLKVLNECSLSGDDRSDGGDDVFRRVDAIDSGGNLSENGNFTDLKVLTECSLSGDDRSDGGDDVLHRVDAIDEMGEGDVKKLYMKIRRLETDRESMMQEIVSIRTDEARLILLREIAQHLSGESRVRVNKPSLMGKFSIVSALKWIMSFGFWREESHQTKYMFGLSGDRKGLLLLLGKTPPYEAAESCFKRSQ